MVLVCVSALAAGLAAGSLAMADVLLWEWSEGAFLGFAVSVLIGCWAGGIMMGVSWLRAVAASGVLVAALVLPSLAQLTGLVGAPPQMLLNTIGSDEARLVDGRPLVREQLWLLPPRSWEVGSSAAPEVVLEHLAQHPDWVVDWEQGKAVQALPWGYEVRASVLAGSDPGLGWSSTVSLERHVPWGEFVEPFRSGS